MTASSHTTHTAPGGTAVDTVYAFPCSYAQEGLWLADRLSPGTAAYNVPAALRL
ncbi:hypothetical protein, partial [Streptomyces prasinus]